jgi:thiamine-monophosphate kinase
VRSGPRRAAVFVDGKSAADVVQAVGAEGAGHVHFG